MIRIAPLVVLFAAAATAQSPVQSTFLGGLVITNTNPQPATALFDVIVTDPNGIVIHQIDCNINTAAGTNGTLGVYVTAVGGTLVGNELNAAAWTLVATATRAHTGGRTAFTLPTPFYLAPGNYGMALHHIGANPVYTNPITANLPSSYSTNEATLNMVSARVRTSTLANAFGGTGLGNLRHPNVALHYVSGNVYVNFEGTPTRGASPLQVQFTPFAVSGTPGGILGYAWDFNNDGTIDSTQPNPTHVYTACGNYTVSLTVVDGLGAYTETKVNYVQTDIVVPSFTNALLGPNTLQFVDTSAPTPQTWAWDLDGDGVIDSNAQNPVWVYPTGCAEVNVSLTTTLACQPPVTLTKRIAVATSYETTFAGGLIISAAATGGTNFFDVDVTNPSGITICGLHVNSSVPAGQPVTINVWQKAGTYVGSVENAALWRPVGSVVATSRGLNQRTFVPLAPPIHLASGLHGIGVEHVGASPAYTNIGTTASATTPDFVITGGLVQAPPIFGPAATSTQYTPRIPNIALHFGTTQTNGAPGYGYIGAGCAGTLGVPGNRATSMPTLGGAASIVVERLPFSIGVMLLGLSRTLSGIGPLPVDMAFLGMPGCPLRVSFDATVTLVGAGNQAVLAYPIPSTASLIGAQVYTQALSLDPALNAFGFSLSDAAVMLVGQ
jgi:PKD repeat protein